MKKILPLLALLTTVILCGCVAQKIPGRHGFYSTKSPALTIEFNGLEYLGEYLDKSGAANVHSYFYSGGDSGQGAWVEILNTREGWNVRPGQVPGEGLPNTGIYKLGAAGDEYYCRTFLVRPGSGKSGLAALPGYTAVRICTKLISSSKKISIGYAEKVDSARAEELFSSQNYGELTQAQKDFFAAFDRRADAVLVMKEFQQGDVNEKIGEAAIIENPWYRFTDFLPLGSQIGKISR